MEHTYPNATVEAKVVSFTNSGNKYAVAYYNILPFVNFELRLYNLDHTLWKTIILPSPPTNGYEPPKSRVDKYPFLAYISDNLFDPDTSIEMIINWVDASTSNNINNIVYKEDGTTLFPLSSLGSRVLKIYKTDVDSFKLIATNFWTSNGSTEVFSLPGTMPCDPCLGGSTGFNVIESGNSQVDINGYPNPADDQVIIEYNLPLGAKDGIIELYEINGRLVKSFKVDNSFRNITVKTNEIKSGTYFYQLKTDEGYVSKGKKLIVIK